MWIPVHSIHQVGSEANETLQSLQNLFYRIDEMVIWSTTLIFQWISVYVPGVNPQNVLTFPSIVGSLTSLLTLLSMHRSISPSAGLWYLPKRVLSPCFYWSLFRHDQCVRYNITNLTIVFLILMSLQPLFKSRKHFCPGPRKRSICPVSRQQGKASIILN